MPAFARSRIAGKQTRSFCLVDDCVEKLGAAGVEDMETPMREPLESERRRRAGGRGETRGETRGGDSKAVETLGEILGETRTDAREGS